MGAKGEATEVLAMRAAPEGTPIAGAPYRLAPGLDPANYKIISGLGDPEGWMAYTHHGDGEYRRGTFAKVGHVWVGLDDDFVIPVSLGDGHHRGLDALMALKRRRANPLRADLRRYMPVFIHGRNYGGGVDELPKWVVALRKWLAWGGIDGRFGGFNDLSGVVVTSSILVALDGDVVPRPGRVAPCGEILLSAMEAASRALAPPPRGAGAGERPGAAARVAARAMAKACAEADRRWPGVAFGEGRGEALVEELRRSGEADLVELSELLFGFGSIKRELHQRLRQMARRRARDEWHVDDRDGRGFWGDLGAADARLNDI